MHMQPMDFTMIVSTLMSSVGAMIGSIVACYVLARRYRPSMLSLWDDYKTD